MARTDKGLLRVEPAQTRAAVFPSPPVAQANDNASTSSGSASQQNIEEVVPSSSPNAARRGQAAVRLSASAPTDLQAAAASLPLQNAGAGLRDRENLCQQGGNAVASHPPPVLIVERPTVPAAPADCGDSRTNLRREREDEETSEHDPETSERVPKRPRTGDAVCGASSPAVPTSSLSSFEMQQQYRESLQKFSKTKLEDLFFGTLSRPILNSFKICNYYYADDLIGFIRSDLETMKSFVEVPLFSFHRFTVFINPALLRADSAAGGKKDLVLGRKGQGSLRQTSGNVALFLATVAVILRCSL